jgi:hypothetical protein
MATSLLYYRLASTNTTKQDIPLPENLPSDQLLEFTQPNKMLAGIAETYQNIITQQVSVNELGIRRMFLRDDGMKHRSFTIEGRLDKTPVNVGVNKLIDFRIRLQRENTAHPHGIIGFKSGNASNFDVDPDALTANTPSGVATKGLMIGDTSIGYSGRIVKRLIFRMTLIYGGTHETVSVV